MTYQEERIFHLKESEVTPDGYGSFLVESVGSFSHFLRKYVESEELPIEIGPGLASIETTERLTQTMIDKPFSSINVSSRLHLFSPELKADSPCSHQEWIETLDDSQRSDSPITAENYRRQLPAAVQLFNDQLDAQYDRRGGLLPFLHEGVYTKGFAFDTKIPTLRGVDLTISLREAEDLTQFLSTRAGGMIDDATLEQSIYVAVKNPTSYNIDIGEIADLVADNVQRHYQPVHTFVGRKNILDKGDTEQKQP